MFLSNLVDVKNFILSEPFLSNKMWILRHVLEVTFMHVKPKMALKKN
jgi:hypothetical protein